MVSDTEEMRPYLAVPKKAEDELWNAAYAEADSLFTDITSWSFDDYLFLNKFRLALMLSEWTAESSEEEILERYGIAPGILAAMRSNADWILYSAEELAKLMGSGRIRDLQNLRKRLEYGVKAELVPLVGLKNIGRVRGRMLYSAGLRTPTEVRKAGFEAVARILGEKVAAGVMEQLKGNVIKGSEPIRKSTQQELA
jgi:helicase